MCAAETVVHRVDLVLGPVLAILQAVSSLWISLQGAPASWAVQLLEGRNPPLFSCFPAQPGWWD